MIVYPGHRRPILDWHMCLVGHMCAQDIKVQQTRGTNNLLELLEKMNLKVADEYNGFGDVASGLRVFVEQLKCKSSGFDEYVKQIDSIEQQVTELEAVITMLDKYVSMLETKVHSAYHAMPS